MEFSDGNIHCRLADSVSRSGIQFVLVDWIQVRHAGGQGNYFSGIAREDKWHELVDQMDIGNDVDLEGLEHVFLKSLRVLASSCGGMNVSFTLFNCGI